MTGWVRSHPGVLALLAVVAVGQLLRKLLEPRLLDSPLVGQLPLFPVLNLAAALLLALVIIWLRVRLGQQLATAARQRNLGLPDPATLPKRYAVYDAPSQITTGALGVLDLILLLLVQATLVKPFMVLADHFRVPRSWANAVFVGVVVLIALLMLIKLWRVGGPMLVLLMWWALDRVVPTAGFLGARAEVASTPTTVARPLTPAPVLPAPVLPAPVTPAPITPAAVAEPTVAAPRVAEAEATVAARPVEEPPTVLADATVVTTRSDNDEATLLKPDAP